MKKILIFLLAIFCFVKPVFAEEVSDVESVNNKVGIHLAVPSDEDLASAARLVNGNGGDWGYVTVVIQDNDQNQGKWQEVFNKMRRLHLIPLVRLATHPEGENWARPNEGSVSTWVSFLNSLNWVVKNRYVILFNEPNHAAEWGGEVDPKSFAEISLKLAKALKKSNKDYFVMLGSVDQATPQLMPQYAAAVPYLEEVIGAIGPENFTRYFSGWSSHSYPNPGFSGSPFDTGFGSVRGYEAELALLADNGINTDQLPIFITETGWKRGALSEEKVADNLLTAFNNVWLSDERVKAVTPFVLNYQSAPFLEFSWQHLGESSFYAQFAAIEGMEKLKGRPEQIEITNWQTHMPTDLAEDSSFHFQIKLENQGQAIWDEKNGYELKLISQNDYYYKFSPLKNIEPGQVATIDFVFHTPAKVGKSSLRIGLFQNGELKSLSKNWQIKINPLEDLTLKYRLLGWSSSWDNFQAEIYDQYENLVYVGHNLHGEKGEIIIPKVRNVAVGERYRVVLLKPYFLPRQKYLMLEKGMNTVRFSPHLALDWNLDGQFTLRDFWPWGKK